MLKLLKWFTDKGDGKHKLYLRWFENTFTPDDFEGLDKMFAVILLFCCRLSIPLSETVLTAYMKTNMLRDVRKYNIKPEDLDSYDYTQASQLQQAVEVIKQLVLSEFQTAMNEDIEGKEFQVEALVYLSEIKREKVAITLAKTYPKLQDGTDITDLSNEIINQLTRVENVYNTDSLIQVINGDVEEDDTMRFITRFGIPFLDGTTGDIQTNMDALGGLYSKLIYTLTGQPAAGKTRFACCTAIYNTLMEGRDVLLIETELSASRIKNIMYSFHYAMRTLALYGRPRRIAASELNKGIIPESEKLPFEEAKIDFNQNHGKLRIVSEFTAETLESQLELAAASLPNLDLVVIDYMGMIDSRPTDRYTRPMPTFEAVEFAFKILRRFIMKHDVCALCLQQFNEDGIKAAEKGADILAGMIQCGQVATRFADVELLLTGTAEQMKAGVRLLTLNKSRDGVRGKVLLRAELDVGMFIQEGEPIE